MHLENSVGRTVYVQYQTFVLIVAANVILLVRSNPKIKVNVSDFLKLQVDYKTRKQPFEIRHHPKNYDRIEPEVDNILRPLPDEKQHEAEKPKKPVKNFIQKNREKAGKGKKVKGDEKNGTVTLTQDQLDAILASVGKVASGEEEKLKISIGRI